MDLIEETQDNHFHYLNKENNESQEKKENFENKECKNDDSLKFENINFTYNEKKNLIDNIKKLGKFEHLEIFKIIKEESNYYTENINGIFININVLKNSTLLKIKNFVNYINKKKEELIKTEILLKEKEEILIKDYKIDYDNNRNSSLNNTINETMNKKNEIDKTIKEINKNDLNDTFKFNENNNFLNKSKIDKLNELINNDILINNSEYDDSSINDDGLINDDENNKEKIILKKKKVKYSGLKARIIKSTKDNIIIKNNDLNDLDNKILNVDMLSKHINNLKNYKN